jgi:choline monooxygenase
MSLTLTAKDCHVDAELARAETLPAAAFTDPAFLEVELKTTFAASWSMIPQTWPLPGADDTRSLWELVSVRGAHVPLTLLGKPLYLQRDWDEVLHCFPNVCTHAWHPLVDGPGRARTVVCPQHGRTFDCAGRFVGQQGFSKEALEGFPRECDHLRDLPVGAWEPFLFTSLGRPAQPFDAWLAPVKESLGALKLTSLRRRMHGEEVREVEGNWKLHAWNYMDTFHITYLHKAPGGLADAIDMSTYRTELFDGASLQWAYAKDPASGFDPDVLPARFRDPARPERRVFALWWFLFPNVTLNFYPWGLSVNIYMPVPGRPDRTLFAWHHFVADDDKYAQREERWLSAQVDAEDVLAMKQVRRGVASGLAPRGRFAPKVETGPHWFHRAVYTSVFGAR